MHTLKLNQVMDRVCFVARDELENYIYEKLLCGHKICL